MNSILIKTALIILDILVLIDRNCQKLKQKVIKNITPLLKKHALGAAGSVASSRGACDDKHSEATRPHHEPYGEMKGAEKARKKTYSIVNHKIILDDYN